MWLIAALIAADVVSLSEVSQVKELCAALREMPADADADPAEIAAAHKAALARRDEALARWYRTEIPSKGFAFGRYREQDKLLELDGDRPARAVEGTLSLDLQGIDDVAFHATPEQVSQWSQEKKAGGLKLAVVWQPQGDRCAGSAAAEAWRVAGKVRSWELVDEHGLITAADAEGEPVGAVPQAVKVERVALDSDGPARNGGVVPASGAPTDAGARLASAQPALSKCAAGAQRGGDILVAFAVQDGRVREPQVIMDSLHDDKVARCVTRALAGAEVGGSGRGTATISLE
jgi:hypothetical protein